MCEIAITSGSRDSNDQIISAAMRIYRKQKSSLGLVAVNDVGGKLEYDVFKRVDPGRDEVHVFVDEHGDADRFIIHGRMATHGKPTKENAHPLEIDCPECDIDYVLHNGIVYGHERLNTQHLRNGHEYQTVVDSEAIAHATETVPTDFDEPRNDLFGAQPSYILLNSERMYIYTNGTYTLSSTGLMRRSGRNDIATGLREDDTGYSEVLLTPSEGGN